MRRSAAHRVRFFSAFLVLVSLNLPPAVLGAPPTITSLWSAPNDQVLAPPLSMSILPDEHTTAMPFIVNPRRRRAPGYLFFVAGNNFGQSGTFALETTDLMHFSLAPGFGDPAHSSAVLWPPSNFTDCQYTGPTMFDQNYAAPGSVVQDPTRPPGNLVMMYEAERHCVRGGGGQYEFNYWASVGLARSSDGGRTWTTPSEYGNDRYAALTVPGTEPLTPHSAMGDALPSAFVDDVWPMCVDGEQPGGCPSGDRYLYAVYNFNGSPSQGPDGYMRIARAKLGGERPLQFKKWYVDPVTHQGGWTQDGVGGLDSGFTPSVGCAEPSYQVGGQISYVDELRLYLLTFVCVNLQGQADNTYAQVSAGWYYSTAQSLENQSWSAPQPIVNSFKPITTDSHGDGRYFDGWYPSFFSPGCKPGHLSLSGQVFLLNGNAIGVEHQFASRAFRIDTTPDMRREEADCRAGEEWRGSLGQEREEP